MKLLITIATLFLPIIAIGFFISQIIFTNNLAQDGSILKDVSAKIDTLIFENERLEQQIASCSSLLEIKKRAEAGGFIEPKRFLTIVQGQYLVALNQKR